MADPNLPSGNGSARESLEHDATSFAQQAVRLDQAGQYDIAVFYYTEAAQALMHIVQSEGAKMPGILDKIAQYVKRGEELKNIANKKSKTSQQPAKTEHQLQLDRAKFLIKQAFEEDESGNEQEAMGLYMEAAELCLKIKSQTKDKSLEDKIKSLATQALDRAEQLKKKQSPSTPISPNIPTNKPVTQSGKVVPPLGFGAFADDDDDGKVRSNGDHAVDRITRALPTSVNIGPGGYTKEEIDVLRKTSDINGRTYVPFLSVDMKERFAFPVTFSDKDGKLALSPKQKQRFARWVRPEDFLDSPQMVYAVSSFSIKQTVVSDCSFVASLAISAQYERRFKKKLITSIVYPQNRQGDPVYNPCGKYMVKLNINGVLRKVIVDDYLPMSQYGDLLCSYSNNKNELWVSILEKAYMKVMGGYDFPGSNSNRQGDPVYNPCGKYMVKLNINGVLRKVIVDDYLPMSQYGDLLCSYSNNKNELWVSILEKAYMKVMGGYDFPGSNSNIDLHALTGWIPERISMRPSGQDDDRFDKDKEFKRLQDRFHKGHCLVTIATGNIPEVEADRAGLVPTHAYAMLDVREVQGKRLLMLKNPWNHLRWKGRFCENDLNSWTPELQKALNYDPKSAQTYDNGVFWIDYESLIHFFEVIYINWNPELFRFTTCLQSSWPAKEGPRKDRYNISDNPQYRLELKSSQPSAAWCLLTRHITDKADFADNREFIALLVYNTGGKKIYYPNDPPPYKDGIRINSPHYLCKLVENKKGSVYTLVVSQYEKNNSIHYTLRVFATCEFSLTKINDPYKKQYEKRITGQWKGPTAGGCGNYPDTHKNNPVYQIKLDNSTTDNYVLIELFGPKEYSVGFEVTGVSLNVPGQPAKHSSGDFRRGFTMLALDRISGGVYNIMPCTFRPHEEGPFFLDISCNGPFSLTQLR